VSERHDAVDDSTPDVEEAPALRATGIRSTGTGADPQPAEGAGAEPAAVPMHQDGWIGRVIDDRYRVVEKLGEGGMGAVFVAEHLKLHKRVALKIILPEFAGDGEMAARFAREAMAGARLDHPHVATALDYGTLPEGGAYLVMQLVRGRSLQALIEAEGRQHWQKACAITAQVADALVTAHTEGVVHRDLKPDNILLEPREGGVELVKVLDFGIARVSAEAGQAVEGAAPTRALTRLGTVMGTPGYMAPEQAVGEAVDHRADLYALGVVLWEMLTGQELFEGHELTRIVTQQLTTDPPSVRETTGDPTLPAALDAFVARLLARGPDDRPQSALEVRDTLQQLALGTNTTGSIPLITGAHTSVNRGTAVGAAPTMMGARPATVRMPATGGIPSTVTVAGRQVPLALLGLGCAVPLVLAGMVTVAMLVFGGSSKDAPAPPAHKIVKLLGGSKGSMVSLPKPIPPEVEKGIDRVLNSSNRAERRNAARWLTEYEPEDDVPTYGVLAAELELARGCNGKKDVLARILEEGDDKVLPALERIDRIPQRGCGFLKQKDCYACLRSELAQTIGALK
jgi:eukaryotic-like serine/threonine-protein kinase